MKVHQVVEAGKVTSSYMSSYNNSLQLTVEGGHEINVKIPEDCLRDLANRLNERIESIETERKEELEAELLAKAEAEAEAEDSLAMHSDD
jgi:predicted PilT family ATPase